MIFRRKSATSMSESDDGFLLLAGVLAAATGLAGNHSIGESTVKFFAAEIDKRVALGIKGGESDAQLYVIGERAVTEAITATLATIRLVPQSVKN